MFAERLDGDATDFYSALGFRILVVMSASFAMLLIVEVFLALFVLLVAAILLVLSTIGPYPPDR